MNEITTGAPPVGGEVATLPAEPLLPSSPAPAPRTCLCKYTVTELVESLKGRTMHGSIMTNAGESLIWGFGQDGKDAT